VFALLDHDELRTQLPHLVSGADQVVVPCQQLGFAVVEHQPVHPLQQRHQIVVVLANPQVHGVGYDQPRADQLFQRAALHRGRPVGQKGEWAAAERVRQVRLDFAQDVQLVIGNLIPDHQPEDSREALVKQGFEGK
jgi:hypothetical protein